MNKSVKLPRHIAVIMDGNGRWAKQRNLPRIAGHRAGVESARRIIKSCTQKGIEVLTLFAFSSENWQRPTQEVHELLSLFLSILQREVKKLHESNILLRIIGDRSKFSKEIQRSIKAAEELTCSNTGLKLIIAVNYGGQWDVMQAVRMLCAQLQQGELQLADITPQVFAAYLATAEFPDPDLFIRTSGEQRISNFLIWQLAYTELYFTNVFWPDFGEEAFEQALDFFASRERRFGCTSEQIQAI